MAGKKNENSSSIIDNAKDQYCNLRSGVLFGGIVRKSDRSQTAKKGRWTACLQVTSTVATMTITRDITMQKGHDGKLGTRGTFAWSNKTNFSGMVP